MSACAFAILAVPYLVALNAAIRTMTPGELVRAHAPFAVPVVVAVAWVAL